MAERRNIFRDDEPLSIEQKAEEAILRRESATLLSFDEAQGEDHISSRMDFASAADWPAWTDDFYYTPSSMTALPNTPDQVP